MDLSIWRRLILLSLGAFLLGIAITFLDVGTVSLFIQKNTFHAIGVDFFGVALCLIWVGSITVKLDRRHGYGGVPLTAFLTFILFCLLKLEQTSPHSVIPVNFLFIYKYLMPLIVTMGFWTIASRFIVLKFSSLKYMGILGASLLGFFFGGYMLSKLNWSPEKTLMAAVWVFIGLVLIMKVLVWLLPQPTETFIRKTGGVQDVSEQKMIDCLLMLAFTYTTARALGDYLLYRSLISSNAFFILSKLWMMCGGFGLLVLMVLSHTRFLYTTLWGLSVLCLGFFFLAEGAFLGLSWLLHAGVIIVWVCSYFYWGPYLSLLPRPLTLGEGIRIRKLRQMLMEPLGFVLAGAFILTLHKTWHAPILAIFTLLLALGMGISVVLYSRLLSHICKMRFWCGGPLMLVSDKLIQRVQKGAESNSFQDVSYFLKIMEIAHFPGLKKQLLKCLQNSVPEARLLALDMLDIHGFYKPKVIQSVRQVFQKDRDSLVRARALAFLIHVEGDYTTKEIYHKYGSYLDDKELKMGAIMGFLQSGGECALLAMDGLQQMVQSSCKQDNLNALRIIDKVPQEGLMRLLIPLFQNSDIEVVRSALLVAGHIGHVQTLNFVFQALDKPELQEEALQALSMYGKKVFPPLEKMLSNPNVPLVRRKMLILFLELISSGEGKQVLLRNLYLPDIKMRKEVFKAISNSKITWVSRARKKVLIQGINQDVAWWHQLQQFVLKCQQSPTPLLGDTFSSLKRSFVEMQQDLRELILMQLLLLKSNTLVKKTISILNGKPTQRFISAAGILQDLFSPKLYQKICPILLAPLAIDDDKPQLMDIEQATTFLEKLIVDPDIPVDRWILANALYGLQKVGDKRTLFVLEKAFLIPEPIVLEAALDLLTHLEKDKKEQEKYLESQINKVPKNFILEDYLNRRRKQ